MSDTDEWPVVKRPEPPKELWGVWNVTVGRWHTLPDRGSRTIVSLPTREEAQAQADWMSRNSFAPYEFVPRLIPPAE